jgi:hypothetical protein
MPVTLKCVVCTVPFSVIPSRVAKGAKYCSYKCHQIGEGKKGGRIRGVQMKAASKGKSYVKRGNRHLHRQIAEENIGRPLHRGEIAHHRDENKFNNRHDNIEVLPSQGEHVRKHIKKMLARRKEIHGH